MNTINRKYAPEIKTLVETQGFTSYTDVARQLSTEQKKVDVAQVHELMLKMKADGLIEYTAASRGRPSKSKVYVVLTAKQMAEQYSVSKITANVSAKIQADGWNKTKSTVFPFSVTYSKMI